MASRASIPGRVALDVGYEPRSTDMRPGIGTGVLRAEREGARAVQNRSRSGPSGGNVNRAANGDGRTPRPPGKRGGKEANSSIELIGAVSQADAADLLNAAHKRGPEFRLRRDGAAVCSTQQPISRLLLRRY
jgi:hypothetical protein